MGNFLSEESRHSRPARQNEDLHVSSGRKRLNEEADISCSVVIPKETKVKRKRLKTTSQYIYDALFIHGENSDVTIISFNREWKLHKVYLRQAGYFNSMFQASQWMESTMEVINLQIPDDNIDENSLHIAFGSLYSEEVLICPSKVVSILAAASLIQLEGLMQQCTEVMKETVCQDNVCLYYKTACMYGQNEVSETCIKWLETNLMANQCQNLLSELEPKLLADVLRSSDLIVIQIEMDIYTLLKKWLYLRLHPDFSGEFKNILSAADKFFREEAQKCKVIFLESKQGKPYINTFKALRLQHIIRDFVSCREIEKDFIVPMSWLTPLYRQQWLSMLRVEQSLDFGPKVYEKDEFDCNGLRCGRLLVRDAEHCWRWNGYNFGLDLLVSYSSQVGQSYFFTLDFHYFQNLKPEVVLQDFYHSIINISEFFSVVLYSRYYIIVAPGNSNVFLISRVLD